MTLAARRAVVLALALGLPAGPAPAGPQNGNWKEPPRKVALATGLPLVYHLDRTSPMTVVALFAAGGKSAVPDGLDGLAYLATRLTLEIPDEGKVQDLMAQATRMNIICSEDYSALFIECLSENLEEALRVAGKIIQDPLMSGLRIARTKEYMKLFAQAEDDDAVSAGRNAALGAFFRGKSYGSATYGTEDSRKAIERKDVLAFYRRFFNSKGLFFTVVSDLDRAQVQAVLEKHFSRFPAGETIEVAAAAPVLPADREVVLRKEAKQAYVGRAFALPAPGPANQAMGTLLEVLLGRGPGSRLWGLRAKEKLAYNVDARVNWTRTAGILEAYLETEAAKSGRASDALDRVLSDLCLDGVTPEELETTKTMAKAGFLRSVETKSDRARRLGAFEVLGLGYEHLTGIFGAIDAVDAQALNEYIRAALPAERAVRVTVGPAEAGTR
jgi:zinc protease